MTPADIAVLVRFKALMPPVQKALHRLGVPCALPETTPFWHDERVQLILNSAAHALGLPLSSGQQSLECPQDILTQGPEAIARSCSQNTLLDQTFCSSQAFLDLRRAFTRQGSWRDLLAWIHLEQEAVEIREKAQKVRLLTLHAAKGLEFEAVFLPALEEGILPFAGPGLWAGGKPSPDRPAPDREEERRLLYVGLTRSQSRLYLSCAQNRLVHFQRLHLAPSTFVQDLDMDLSSKVRSVARTRNQEQQLSLLSFASGKAK